MSHAVWPSSAEVHAAVAERLSSFLDEHGGAVAYFGRRVMSGDNGVLAEHPHSVRTVLVPGACIAAGGDWRLAIWPTVGSECLMAAADLFDDVADADPGSDMDNPGVLLTAAAGLLGLSSTAVVRAIEDGVSAVTAASLANLLGVEFARAANGQAVSLQSHQNIDALTAYRQAAAKSGPLGSLMARLGARTATDDVEIVDLLGQFGARLAVRDQLRNDMRDAAPDPTRLKADVRAGARTVPLVFAGSTGAPPDLDEAELVAWEIGERARVAASGGLTAALALAEAERLGILAVLQSLEHRGCATDGLREFIG